MQGTRGRQAISVRPFRLSPSGSSRPSKFEFVIQTAGIVYNYGFRVDTNRVCEEWLYATPRTQEVLYFQRVAAEDGTVQVEFGPSWVGRGNKRKQFLEFVAQGTRPNQLFLTEAVERNLQECLPLVEWFRTRLIVLSAESSMNDLEMRVQGDRPLAQFVEAVLSSTGTGIEAILAEENPFDLDSLVPALPDPVRQSLEANLAEAEAVIVNLHGPQDQRKILKRGPQGELKAVSLRMLHSAAEGPPVAFSMEEESDGTQRLIHLTPALSLLRQNSEQVLLIDELDRRLHTQLSRFFVQATLDYDDSPRQTQRKAREPPPFMGERDSASSEGRQIPFA